MPWISRCSLRSSRFMSLFHSRLDDYFHYIEWLGKLQAAVGVPATRPARSIFAQDPLCFGEIVGAQDQRAPSRARHGRAVGVFDIDLVFGQRLCNAAEFAR